MTVDSKGKLYVPNSTTVDVTYRHEVNRLLNDKNVHCVCCVDVMTSKPPAAIPMKHQSSSRSDNATAEVETCTRRHKVGGKQMHCGHTFTDECWECFHSFAALWTEKSNITSEI